MTGFLCIRHFFHGEVITRSHWHLRRSTTLMDPSDMCWWRRPYSSTNVYWDRTSRNFHSNTVNVATVSLCCLMSQLHIWNVTVLLLVEKLPISGHVNIPRFQSKLRDLISTVIRMRAGAKSVKIPNFHFASLFLITFVCILRKKIGECCHAQCATRFVRGEKILCRWNRVRSVSKHDTGGKKRPTPHVAWSRIHTCVPIQCWERKGPGLLRANLTIPSSGYQQNYLADKGSNPHNLKSCRLLHFRWP